MIGIIGPRLEAMEIKQKIGDFLQEKLKLELSEEKTLVTDASQTAAKFLNYEIQGQYSNTKLSPMSGRHTRRSTNGIMSLRVPKSVYEKPALFKMQTNTPLLHDSKQRLHHRQ
jgi:hypothetical protein